MILKLILSLLFFSVRAQEKNIPQHQYTFKQVLKEIKERPFVLAYQQLTTSFGNPKARDYTDPKQHEVFYTQRLKDDCSMLSQIFTIHSPTMTNAAGFNLAYTFLENRAQILLSFACVETQGKAYKEFYVKPMLNFLYESGVPFADDDQVLLGYAQQLEVTDTNPFSNIQLILSLKKRSAKTVEIVCALSSLKVRWSAQALECATSSLIDAWRRDNLPLVTALLELPIDVNSKNPHDNNTSLHYAARQKLTQMAITLSKRPPIDANAQNNNGSTALHYAAESDSYEIVTALLDNPTTKINTKDNNWRTALMVAAEKDSAEAATILLKQQSTDVNAQDKDGCTALHLAIESDAIKIVTALLERSDININLQNKGKRTPLMWAKVLGRTAIVTLLESDKSISAKRQNVNGSTVLHLATINRDTKTVTDLLKESNVDVNAQDNTGKTALHYAARNGDGETIKALLNHPSINATLADNNGRTPLISAQLTNNTRIATLLEQHLQKNRLSA